MIMNAFEFLIDYKKSLSSIEQIVQPKFLKYTNKLSRIKPSKMIKSNTTFNSEFEALGFVLSLVLGLYYDDDENIDFDDDESLLYADQLFIQSMNFEFGKMKGSLKNNTIVWTSDLSNVLKRKDIKFKIVVITDKKSKSIKELLVSSFSKKTNRFIGKSSALFLGNTFEDIRSDIYNMAESLVDNFTD
jgi:hypothetical protein